jgi:hypothetical protein
MTNALHKQLPFPELAEHVIHRALIEASLYLEPPDADALHLRYRWNGWQFDLIARPVEAEAEMIDYRSDLPGGANK